MAVFEKLRVAAAHPHLAVRELYRAYHRRLYTRSLNDDGVDVFDEDWDNLVVLDACRYDVFAAVAASSLPGTLERRTSQAATTPEFVRANFGGRDLHDTVYVTQNTWYLKLRDDIDASVHDVANPRQDPGAVTDRALAFDERYPNKRLVVHYLPPHHPYIGPTAERELPSYEEQFGDFLRQVQRGRVDLDDATLRAAYRENLERVLPEVERLLDALAGKTVVTADHGELLGETLSPVPVTVYGHHRGLYVDELVDVPWLVVPGNRRKRVRAEAPAESAASSCDRDLDRHLRQLGYTV
jgi:hypothetical protein